MRSRYLFPSIAFFAVWLPGSIRTALRMGRRLRLSGPDQDSWTPIIDAWTQTAQAWLAPAFFAAVFVFVFERWLEQRKTEMKIEVEKRN
ncbi:MAG TPA: hypothetical protein VE967_06725 [Gemmatimonadaceae bacterium]|nr:hypothetical protein [Gemmatimonadaceae bacterium]